MSESKIQPEIIITADGSHSLYIKDLDETYHSRHGARQESEYVFIRQGLEYFQSPSSLKVLEIGFGTGLNAVLTANWAEVNKCAVEFVTLEKHPLDWSLLSSFNVETTIGGGNQELFEKIHFASWDELVEISDFFSVNKQEADLLHTSFRKEYFDVIFYDAFGPRAQDEMWQAGIWKLLYESVKKGGVLVTYCSKGQVRRDMISAGWMVEKLAGPPGKREMMRAVAKI